MTTHFSFCVPSRSTILVKFLTEKNSELQYKPGDHVAIFPANRPELVQALIDRLSDDVDPDLPIIVEVLREVKGKNGLNLGSMCLLHAAKFLDVQLIQHFFLPFLPGFLGTTKKWQPFSRLPCPITVREALSRYLDITSVPSPQIIKFLATMVSRAIL